MGYVISENVANTVNKRYGSTHGVWLINNKSDLGSNIITTSNYFTNNLPCFTCFTMTTSIEGLNLSLIQKYRKLIKWH